MPHMLASICFGMWKRIGPARNWWRDKNRLHKVFVFVGDKLGAADSIVKGHGRTPARRMLDQLARHPQVTLHYVNEFRLRVR